MLPAQKTGLIFSQTLAAAFVVALAAPGSARAQSSLETPAPSPKAKVEQRVGVTDLAVEYSSPAVKGRKIWGALVPLDQLWRTGANAATKLTASRDFTVGGKQVPAGSYALYTIPGKTSWTVILNSNWNTGGTNGYDQKNDVARFTVKPEPAPYRERLAFIFSETTDDRVRLDLEWEKLRVSIPITLDTQAHVLASIDKTLADTWRPHFGSARWLLESGGDLDRALVYVDTSIQIKATWWNHWVKAQILAKKGKAADAVAIAEKATELGKGDTVFEGFFKADVTKAIEDWKKKKS